MKRSIVLAIVLLPLLVAPAWAAASAPPQAPSRTAVQDSMKRRSLREGWPDTRVGEIAFRWVEAFSTGEDAMRSFRDEFMAEKSGSQANAKVRIESYRKLRERFGTLMLGEVERSTPGEIKASLIASDASVHPFIFKLQAQPPYKLLSVSMVQRAHGSWGFHH